MDANGREWIYFSTANGRQWARMFIGQEDET
ncbi:MAG: hypothetical protein RI897_185, partial [Verrucomicrobiota bacterium]